MERADLLHIQDLSIAYLTRPPIFAVNAVSFSVRDNEVIGLVGESGSGKSTLAMGILGLLPRPGRILQGSIVFDGIDLAHADDHRWREIRWRKIAYVPQGAMNALNPVLCVRSQFYDIIRAHEDRRPTSADERKLERLLAKVRLPPRALHAYPHELSGGMKQRVCIAMSILLSPKLVIADEPTSALDVISQRLVLETLADARQQLKASMILVGHDLALQAQMANRIGIMFAGRLVEIGPVNRIFKHPHHPYTKRLISSVPSIQRRTGIRNIADKDSQSLSILPDARLNKVGTDHYALPSEQLAK
jgi:ABC-type glutathione transport system ATPase component